MGSRPRRSRGETSRVVNKQEDISSLGNDVYGAALIIQQLLMSKCRIMQHGDIQALNGIAVMFKHCHGQHLVSLPRETQARNDGTVGKQRRLPRQSGLTWQSASRTSKDDFDDKVQ